MPSSKVKPLRDHAPHIVKAFREAFLKQGTWVAVEGVFTAGQARTLYTKVCAARIGIMRFEEPGEFRNAALTKRISVSKPLPMYGQPHQVLVLVKPRQPSPSEVVGKAIENYAKNGGSYPF